MFSHIQYIHRFMNINLDVRAYTLAANYKWMAQARGMNTTLVFHYTAKVFSCWELINTVKTLVSNLLFSK